ncbi:MAG: hypothetical protein U5J97_09325 [Trueperaceae bacterium]|nr:hypothetical protein [Trueperaceae bacterium]
MLGALALPSAAAQVRLRVTFALATGVGLLMLVQSATGMLLPGLYRDPAFALAAWRVNDPVTLFVAVPVLFASLALARRGSARGYLVLLGVLQYALYTYAFYLFGAALNVHFLLYVTSFVASGAALIAGSTVLDPVATGRSFSAVTTARWVSGYMGVWSLVLGLAWVGQWLAYVATGSVPEIGAEPFRLIAALDLSLVVAPVALGAAWLWSQRGWGFVIAVVMNVKGAIYAGMLAVGSLVGGGDELLGLWVFFTVGSLTSLAFLLVSMRAASPGEGPRRPASEGPLSDTDFTRSR